MKIAVTGSAGFIGAHLVDRLAREGHEVHALVRSMKPEYEANGSVFYHLGDLLDDESLNKLVSGCEVVFHLAAFAKMSSTDEKEFFLVNVEGTSRLLRAAKTAGVRKFMLTSTAGRFGPSDCEPVTEETIRQVGYMNLYEETKEMSEKLALSQRSKDFEVVVLSPTRVYGPGRLSEANGVTRMTRLYLQGKFRLIPGDGNFRGNYVYVGDVVEGHLLAMKYGRSGEVYLLGGENHSLNELFHELADVSNQHRWMLHLPTWMVLSIARLMEHRQKIFGKPPLITLSWLKRYLKNWEVSSAKAAQELGYRITSLDEGLKKTVAWLNESGQV